MRKQTWKVGKFQLLNNKKTRDLLPPPRPPTSEKYSSDPLSSTSPTLSQTHFVYVTVLTIISSTCLVLFFFLSYIPLGIAF
jgi:hypothetical protein